jgi:HAD superfamily hydrolase (TIGR01509 family)
MKTILVDAVNTFILKDGGSFKINKEMQELLETYPNNKVILTNTDDEQKIKFGLDKAPYEVFTLYHDPEKTDPQYYELMLYNLGLDFEDVVYFEHNPEAVKSAESFNIKSYHYNPEKKDLVALKKFLDDNLNN